jgi:hypothetical protein
VQGASPHPKGLEQRLDQGGHRRLAQSAQTQGGDSDPELADREVGVEPPRRLFDQTGRPPALLDEPVHLRGPDLDQRELRGHEETIQSDQKERSEDS